MVVHYTVLCLLCVDVFANKGCLMSFKKNFDNFEGNFSFERVSFPSATAR
jgi:hypothetical protein